MMSHEIWIITRLVHRTNGFRVVNRNGQAKGSPTRLSATLCTAQSKQKAEVATTKTTRMFIRDQAFAGWHAKTLTSACRARTANSPDSLAASAQTNDTIPGHLREWRPHDRWHRAGVRHGQT